MDLKKEIKLSSLFNPRPLAARTRFRRGGGKDRRDEQGVSESKPEVAEMVSSDVPEAKKRLKLFRVGLRKEIKLSDLFKRPGRRDRHGAADAPESEFAEVASPDAPDGKRRLNLFRRKPTAAKEPGAPKEPKPSKRKVKRREDKRAQVPELPLMRAFNLLPKDTPRVQKRERPPIAQVALAVVALVLVSTLAAVAVILRASVADKEAQRDELAEVITSLQAMHEPEVGEQGEAVDTAAVVETNARTAAVASALGGRVAWDRIFRELSLVTPEDVWLTGMTVTPAAAPQAPPAPDGESTPSVPLPLALPSSMTINGFAFEQGDVAQILSRLALVPELTSVQLLSSSTVSLEEIKLIQFSVAVAVKPAGGSSA